MPVNTTSTPLPKGKLMVILTEPHSAVYDPPLPLLDDCDDGLVHISVPLARVFDELAPRRVR